MNRLLLFCAILLVTNIKAISERLVYHDVTGKYLENPAFLPGWQGALTDVQYGVGEVYNGAFNLYQVLPDMPAGDYILTANACYRCGTYDFSKANQTGNPDLNTTFIYADNNKQVVKGFFENTEEAPNSLSEISMVFQEGMYFNTLSFTHNGGDLTIGICNTGCYGGEWAVFDNFTLRSGDKDYTALIKNADFSEGLDMQAACWDMVNSMGTVKTPDANKDGGVYRKTNASPYNFGQQVELPAGKYRFSALTFQRYGGSGNYDGKIISCKGEWKLQDVEKSPKQWWSTNSYRDDDFVNNAYLYVSFEQYKPLSLTTSIEMLEENVRVVRLKGSWEICDGDYVAMPENETRGNANGVEIIPAYETKNVCTNWCDSGMERESAAAFVNNPDKWRQYIEFELTQPAKVWIGLGKDENSPAQYWNPFADFKLETLVVEDKDLTAGDDFEYEGVWYTVLDAEARTCQTKAGVAASLAPGSTVSGQLTIPSVVKNGGYGLMVEKIGNYSFCNLDGLTSVEIPESVTSIGIDAFYRCKGLEKVTLPNSVTEIGNYAFNECAALTSITLPESLRTISNNVFGSCTSLFSVSFPATLSSIGEYAFSGCSSLENLALPDSLSTLNNGAFFGCRNLEKVFIPEGVKSVGYLVFGEATLIDSVKYAASTPIAINTNNFDEFVYDKAVLEMPNATLADIKGTSPWNKFSHIIAKDGTEFPTLAVGSDFEYNGIWYTVTNSESRLCRTKEGAYNNGDKISGNNVAGDIVIPSVAYDEYNGYSVVEIGEYSFCNNTELTSIFIPESVNDIETEAFDGCSNLSKAKFASIESLCSINFWSSSANPLNLAHNLYIGEEEVTEIVIPESVTAIKFCAFTGGRNLTSVVLHDGVTVIDGAAFDGCSQLKSIDFPSSLISIGSDAFYDCKSLVYVNLPENLQTIGNYAFMHCSSMTSVTIPAGITSIGNNAFSGTALSTVTYNAVSPIAGNANIFSSNDDEIYNNATLNTPNATIASVQAIAPWNLFKHIVATDGSVGFVAAGDDFEYQGIWYTIIDVDTKTCRTKDGYRNEDDGTVTAGNNCEGDIVIPSIVTYNGQEYHVTEIGAYGFYGNENMSSIALPSSLVSIQESAFAGCDFTSIDLPESLEIIGNSSFASTTLTSLLCPGNLRVIEDEAFWGSTHMTTLSLPASLESMGETAFNHCTNLNSVTYLASEPREFPENVFYSANEIVNTAVLHTPNATLQAVRSTVPWNKFLHIEAKDGSLAPAGQGDQFEFDGILYIVTDVEAKTCSTKPGGALPEDSDGNVGDLIIPQTVSDGIYDYTVTVIGSRSFENVEGITSVSIPESVTMIGSNAFLECTHLTSVSLSEGLQTIDNSAFMNCTELISVEVPQSVTALQSMAFDGCSSLISVTLPESLTKLNEMLFSNCSSLESVNIPSTVTSIENQAFLYCERLSSVKLPDGLKFIGYRAFEGCRNIDSLVLPESLTTMENSAFYGCSGISSITLPASLTEIEHNSFNGCSSITSVTIPESVTSIGTYAFRNCTLMKSLTLPSTLSSLGEMVFAGSPIEEVNYNAASPISENSNVFDDSVYTNATLNMPDASLADIRSTVPWNLFKQIVAKDGSIGFVAAGDDFEYEGIWYTILDPEAKTCKTKDFGNLYEGDLYIPELASYDSNEFSVVEIGIGSFANSSNLYSISIPSSVTVIAKDAFEGCERLTSLIWRGDRKMQSGVVDAIGNPNILVYVDGSEYAPSDLDRNVVAGGVCENLVLTPGYPFHPVEEFISNYSSMTKEFTQETPLDGCAGWETIVLPFDAVSVRVKDPRGELTPFSLLTDINTQYPYWLYEVDSEGEWQLADSIKAGIPYLISMPNNPDYEVRYNINGQVVFSCPDPIGIYPETASPYAVTWASGRQFRSLWLPLDEEEAADAMGLNVGIDNLTEDGEVLAPGSAFHVDVLPKPLEAYVTRNGSQRAFRISGAQSGVLTIPDAEGFKMTQDGNILFLQSSTDRLIPIFSVDGTVLRKVMLKAGEPLLIEGLPQGVCIIAGRKVMIK